MQMYMLTFQAFIFFPNESKIAQIWLFDSSTFILNLSIMIVLKRKENQSLNRKSSSHYFSTVLQLLRQDVSWWPLLSETQIFGMIGPGIEHQSSGPLVNTLTARPMDQYKAGCTVLYSPHKP